MKSRGHQDAQGDVPAGSRLALACPLHFADIGLFVAGSARASLGLEEARRCGQSRPSTSRCYQQAGPTGPMEKGGLRCLCFDGNWRRIGP